MTATDAWFIAHGLAYFVPEQRAEARAALRPRRVVPVVLLVLLAAVVAAGGLAWLADSLSIGPAVLVTVTLTSAGWYALTALRARAIVTWALSRTFGSLATLLPMMTRALPLLLVFVTFLFINAEVWQVTSRLDGGILWLTVLLFTVMAVAFLLVRLPEEVDRTDDDVDDGFLLRACTGTPLEEQCRALVEDPAVDPTAYAEVRGFERWNLVMVLVIIQAVQVLLLAVTVFAFFVLFGTMVMTDDVIASWIAEDPHTVPHLGGLSAELLQVSVFLAGFSALYLTVSTVTDETYREQFFGGVMTELHRAVGVRAVYRALRASSPTQPDPTQADPTQADPTQADPTQADPAP